MVDFAHAIFAIWISLVFGVGLRDILSSSVPRLRQIQRPKLRATWWLPTGSLRTFTVLRLVASLQPLHLRILSSLRIMSLRMRLTINWVFDKYPRPYLLQVSHWPLFSTIIRLTLLKYLPHMVTHQYLPGILEDKGQVFTSLPDLFFDKCFNDLIYQVSTRPFLSTTSAWPCSSISRTGYGWVSKTLSLTKCLHRPFHSTSIRLTLLKYLQDWLRMSIHKAFLIDKYLQDIYGRVSTRPSFRQISIKTSSLPSFQGRYFPARVSRLTIFFRFDFVHQGWRVSLHQSSS
jgi:hypothetical protein